MPIYKQRGFEVGNSEFITWNYISGDVEIGSGLYPIHFNKRITYLLFKCFTIGLMSRVFANGPGGRGLIPGRVIPKTQKMVLDAALLNTQHYKVWIKGNGAIQGKEKRPPTPRVPTLFICWFLSTIMLVTLCVHNNL